MARRHRLAAVFRTTASTIMQHSAEQLSGVPFGAAAWALSRVGVALYLLAAAGQLGHAGLLSRILSH